MTPEPLYLAEARADFNVADAQYQRAMLADGKSATDATGYRVSRAYRRLVDASRRLDIAQDKALDAILANR